MSGRVKVQGTILHLDSLLMNYIEDHDGCVFRAYYTEDRVEFQDVDLPVEIHDGQKVKLVWASRWTWADLMKKKDEMKSVVGAFCTLFSTP